MSDNLTQFPGQTPIVVPPAPPEKRIVVMRTTVAELIGRANALGQLQNQIARSALLPNPPQVNLGPIIIESNACIMRSLALLLDERLADEGQERVTTWTMNKPEGVEVTPPGNGNDAS